MISKTFIVIFLPIYVAISNVEADETLSDAKLNFTQLAIKYGLPCQEYDVITEDGYILKMFRIPGNKTKPVLYMHGLLDTADSAILRGHKSLGYILANEGYDVWASNYRGNRYSRRHVTLNPDNDTAFWEFSMHEHGVYDLSASIDFILNKTKARRASLIGHSEGTVIMFILGSVRPEYNDKINVFMAWAPVCYVHNIVNHLPWFLSFARILKTFLYTFDVHEILSHDSTGSIIERQYCTLNPQICLNLLYMTVGYGPDGVEQDYLRTLVGHYPAGTSRKNLEHYYQVILKRKFVQYDYGLPENLIKYNSLTPSAYNLRNVTVKVAMFVAEHDYLSTPEDVSTLRKKLPNVVFYKLFKQMNHIDLVHSQYAYKVVFPTAIKLLETYT